MSSKYHKSLGSEPKSKKVEEKPSLKILFASKYGGRDAHVAFLSKKYNVTVLNYDNLTTKPDLIVFTGGADVDPEFYGEKRGSKTSINRERDNIEYEIFNEFIHIPKLGICRGSQFLTMANGGKLVQHVENHTQSHDITVASADFYGSNGTYPITSTHHQMMYPFNLSDDQYEILGWSTYFRSPTYLNGRDKEIVLADDFMEPEIVFYPRRTSLAIQGHPEFNHCDDRTQEMCLKLIDHYLINRKRK